MTKNAQIEANREKIEEISQQIVNLTNPQISINQIESNHYKEQTVAELERNIASYEKEIQTNRELIWNSLKNHEGKDIKIAVLMANDFTDTLRVDTIDSEDGTFRILFNDKEL